MHDHNRRNRNLPTGAKPGRAAPGLLVIMLTLGTLLMGCDLLGIAVLPSTTDILKEARKAGHSPFEVLEKHYELKKEAINTRYDKEIKAIESKLSDGVMTSSEAGLKKNLAELKKAQELVVLEVARDEREEEMKELAEIINN